MIWHGQEPHYDQEWSLENNIFKACAPGPSTPHKPVPAETRVYSGILLTHTLDLSVSPKM